MEQLPQTTLILALEDEYVWLGMKKEGFGSGKWNGYGGKVHEGESILEAAIREFKEETTAELDPEDLLYVGFVDFTFKTKPHFNQRVNFYVAENWNGNISETAEMRSERFPKKQIPWDDMWTGDDLFIPLMLDKTHVEGRILFDGDDQEQHVVEAEFQKPEGYAPDI